MDLIADFVQAAPEAVRATLEEMLREPKLSVAALRRQVVDHTRTYVAAAATGEDLDPTVARMIEERCLELLDRVAAGVEEPWPKIIQAACEYYVFDDDADGDFDTVAGLDDDAEVINVVYFLLGEDDKTIKIG